MYLFTRTLNFEAYGGFAVLVSGFLYLLLEIILRMIIVLRLCMVRLRGILLLVVTIRCTRYMFHKQNQLFLVLPLLR